MKSTKSFLGLAGLRRKKFPQKEKIMYNRMKHYKAALAAFALTLFALGFAACSSPMDSVAGNKVLANVGTLKGIAGNGKVTLTWLDPVDTNLASIEITVAPAIPGSPFSVAKGVTTRDIEGLANNTLYTFTVKAVDTSGNKSTGVSVTATPGTPNSPDKPGASDPNAAAFIVTFNADGGTLLGGATATAAAGDTVSGLPEADRPGYSFGGWYTGRNGGGSLFTTGTPVTAGITVYALWTAGSYTVIFNADGGVLLGSPTATVTAGGNVSSLPGATKTGYTFGGWWTEPFGGGTQFNTFTPVNATFTVFAKWIAEAASCTVFFIPDGGSLSGSDYVTVSAGGRVSSLPSATKTGYTFGGWWTESGGGGSQFTISTTVNSTFAVYAKWTPLEPTTPVPVTYTVYFYADGGSLSGADRVTVAEGGRVSSIPGVTRSGYTFGGWYTAPDGGGSLFTSSTAIYATTAVYAKWISAAPATYTVSFFAAGGTLSGSETATVTAGGRVSSLPSASMAGYTFGGWWTESSGGNEFTSTTTVNSSITVFAKWIMITYTVSFNAGEGSIAGSSTATARVGGTVSNLPSATRQNYTFDGWYTGQNGDGSPFTSSTAVTGNITVYAKWTVIFVPVTDITGVPTKVSLGADRPLTGTVAPANATNQTIVWSVKTPGTTGASIVDGNKLRTTAEGTATVTATITNGLSVSSNYMQDFDIISIHPLENWTAVTSLPYPRSITYGAGKFAIVANAETSWSNDGLVWNDIRFSDSALLGSVINRITYVNKKFFVVGRTSGAIGIISWSTNDGQTWTTKAPGIYGGSFNDITYGAGKFVAVSDGGGILWSSDLQTWYLSTDIPFGIYTVRSIAYGAGKFVAVGSSGKMAWSTYGLTWNGIDGTASSFGIGTILSITYGAGKFVAVGDSGKMVWSTDGLTWNGIDGTASSFGIGTIYSIAYGAGKFVAVGDSGKMAWSTDGQTWNGIDGTASTFGVYSIDSITYGAGKFIAVSDDGKGRTAYCEYPEED
jgi:uncharacterized repeat protein (TIGR02543 family)